MPVTGATKMCFDKKFCGFFDYIFSYFFIKVFVIQFVLTKITTNILWYECEEIHLFMILYLGLGEVMILLNTLLVVVVSIL